MNVAHSTFKKNNTCPLTMDELKDKIMRTKKFWAKQGVNQDFPTLFTFIGPSKSEMPPTSMIFKLDLKC